MYASLPEPARECIGFIMHSPQLFSDVASKAELDMSKSVIGNVASLLKAVKSVLKLDTKKTE